MNHAMNDSFKVTSDFQCFMSTVWGLCAAVLSSQRFPWAKEASVTLMQKRLL